MDDPRDLAWRLGAKRMMRRRFRSLRSAIPQNGVEARSARLRQRLLALPEIAHANSLALFWPIERFKEVDLRPLDAALRARGAQLAYPAIDPQSDRMAFRVVAEPAQLVERGRGFAEPDQDAPEVELLDIVVVPGIAFDERGFRIGYGAGYYDRALPHHCPPALAVGVAFDFQLAADIPEHDGDARVDIVITDARELRCS